jgi:two-component system, response regulator
MAKSVTILLVEDNPDDAALIERALRQTPAPLEVASDAQKALDYLFDDANDLPRLVLLDLERPDADGLEVLRHIRGHERTSLIPVVILTSSMDPNDVARCYLEGANSFVRKPSEFDRLVALVRQIISYWSRSTSRRRPRTPIDSFLAEAAGAATTQARSDWTPPLIGRPMVTSPEVGSASPR